jgi:hypothetical protein
MQWKAYKDHFPLIKYQASGKLMLIHQRKIYQCGLMSLLKDAPNFRHGQLI